MLTKPREIRACGGVLEKSSKKHSCFSGWAFGDGELPRISGTVTAVRCRRAVPVRRDEWTPVRLCAALLLAECCARNCSCFCEERTLNLPLLLARFPGETSG